MKQPDSLIAKLQAGDQMAFSQLYEMYSHAIFGVINAIVGDEKESEEVLQDVFVKVWQKNESYSATKGRFYTWLLNIARNSAIDRVRSKAYKDSSKNLSTSNFVDIIKASESLEGRTDAIGITKFIKRLKPVCIRIIDLLYFKGFTQKDAAEQLEIPLGTLKTRNRNCMMELRTILLG